MPELARYHRRRARHRGIAGGQTGAVTAIQRVGSFANANVRFHTVIPEGVWYERPDGSLGFHPLPPPTDEDVEDITERIAEAEAVQLRMSLAEPVPRTSASRRRCAFIDGFSLQADTSVDAADRPALVIAEDARCAALTTARAIARVRRGRTRRS